MRFASVAAALAAVLPSSCSTLTFDEQTLAMRVVPGDDALEMRLLYRGLAPGDRGQRPAVEAVAGLVQGERFMVGGWLFDFDRARMLESLEEDRGPEEGEPFVRWLARFEISESGFADRDQQGVVVWQVVRLPDLQQGLRHLNAALSALARRELVHEDGGDPPLGDPALREPWLQAAEGGHRWVAFEDGGLRVAVPVSPRAAADLLRELAADESGEGADLLGPLSAVVSTETEAVLRFEPGPEGWITWRFDHDVEPAPADFRAAVGEELDAAEPPAWARE